MAATKLIAMHQNKGRSVMQCLKDRTDYAKNGEKTEDGKYISSYKCQPDFVDWEFAQSKIDYLKKTWRQPKGDVIAYQIRQSFKPGEITPEEANEVGYETGMRFTKGKHAFIVATHVDRAHIHNHIIFNSTNLDCDRKFRDFWFSGIALQRLSDIICLEHGLSIIPKTKPSERQRRTKYPERVSMRDIIREDILKCLDQKPADFEELLKLLQAEGYEIKRGKHTAICGKEQKRFIRFRSLGDNFSEEHLKKVIAGEAELPENKTESREPKQPPREKRKFDLVVDIQEKMAQGKNGGYVRWAKKYNVKQFAESILFLQQHDIHDKETLDALVEGSAARYHELMKIIKDAETKMAENKVLKTHIINYSKTRDIYLAYRKSGYSKKFFEAHREEITLHKAAKEAFSNLPGGKIPKVKDLNEEFARLLSEKKTAYSEYKKIKKEMRDYQIAKQNVESFYAAQKTWDQEEDLKKKRQQQR
ncbi:relaxase/mobilization nuclease domain-containing protein [Cellulosilyticum sp. WCF-2]|uniref:relaxase/mobilization nuclease domain-containing protein n=1 Tax=Cellulosilyticum sp. WCF-2 TaxID=2497860 RepID=UPI000F8F4C5C|nr:relaxase/mobilization nuclease domain-containing protein [Cellulosilyticum sp. WCF-2]QEH70576.1 relaxase/mobilization nuclease domain-containing protein [Cellulosilyticum sp. WCF-2]